MGVNQKGYIIPVPNGDVIAGVPKLTIYKPMDFGGYYDTVVMILKNFNIKALVGDPTYSN